MSNQIPEHLLLGCDNAPGQNGYLLTEALQRFGEPLADATLFIDGAAVLTRQIVGTWTPGLGANGVPFAQKAAAAEVGHATFTINEHTRLAAERGLLLVGADLHYAVATAALTELRLVVADYDGSVADGAQPGRAVLGGDVDAHYDEGHDTAAERGAIGAAKKLTVTLPPPQAHLGGYHAAALEVFATDPGTSVFTIHGVTLLFQRVDLDVVAPA